MTSTDEYRALVEQGPCVVMVARADMLALLDTVASLQAAVAVLRERASRWPMVPHIAPPAPEPVA